MDVGARLAILQEAMEEVNDALRTMDASPRVRELRSRAASYERILAGWSYRPPTEAQASAMLECVMELHALVIAPSRRSLRPPAPWNLSTSRRTSRPPPSVHTRTTRPPPKSEG